MSTTTDRFQPAPGFGTAYWLLLAFVPASIAVDLTLYARADLELRSLLFALCLTKYALLPTVAALVWLAGRIRDRARSS
ncbi:MAG: hypothetical protein R3E86_07960 [Pseudomonadales bacterium]